MSACECGYHLEGFTSAVMHLIIVHDEPPGKAREHAQEIMTDNAIPLVPRQDDR